MLWSKARKNGLGRHPYYLCTHICVHECIQFTVGCFTTNSIQLYRMQLVCVHLNLNRATSNTNTWQMSRNRRLTPRHRLTPLPPRPPLSLLPPSLHASLPLQFFPHHSESPTCVHSFSFPTWGFFSASSDWPCATCPTCGKGAKSRGTWGYYTASSTYTPAVELTFSVGRSSCRSAQSPTPFSKTIRPPPPPLPAPHEISPASTFEKKYRNSKKKNQSVSVYFTWDNSIGQKINEKWTTTNQCFCPTDYLYPPCIDLLKFEKSKKNQTSPCHRPGLQGCLNQFEVIHVHFLP